MARGGRRNAATEPRPVTIDLLYGDHEGGQRMMQVLALAGAERIMARGGRTALEPRPAQPSLTVHEALAVAAVSERGTCASDGPRSTTRIAASSTSLVVMPTRSTLSQPAARRMLRRAAHPVRHAPVAALAQRVGMTESVDDARAYIAKVRWQFASTMPRWPHEYTVLQWRQDLEPEFRAFVALIRRAGVIKPWPRDSSSPRYHHTYLELDEWEYWTMGQPVDETTLINRALLPGVGLRVDVLPAGEQERDGQDEDHAGVGAELEQGL